MTEGDGNPKEHKTSVARFGLSAAIIVLISFENLFDLFEIALITPEIREFFVKVLLIIAITEWGWIRLDDWDRVDTPISQALSQIAFVVGLSAIFGYAGTFGGILGAVLVILSGVLASVIYGDLVARGGNPTKELNIKLNFFEVLHYLLALILLFISCIIAANICECNILQIIFN